jgi:ABC-type transporter Mla maintaining outer membrane lipid asymmetry permease subunit MlaE
MAQKSKFKKFLLILLFLVVAAGILGGLQFYNHIFDKPLKMFDMYISKANTIVYKDMFWGISTGTLLFIVILIILPILMRKINTRSYFKNLFQGIISSLIFFLSQAMYQIFERISKFYLLVSLFGVVIITLILIRIVAGTYKNEADQVEFRTNFVASITAGLIFSVLLQLISLWGHWLTANFHSKFPIKM